MSVLTGLEPQNVLYYFEELTKIPRGSGNEKEVSDFLKNFAMERNLEVIQDEFLNIIIKKPGTEGYENSAPIILQGHMDMVNEKNNDVIHDFDKDPLKLRLVGDDLYATGTTLGADNGIAVAFALAILDSKNVQHPPLEVLVTVEEETGLIGATNLDGSVFKGKTLINIDSEEEGKFLVSCAGGARQTVKLPLALVKKEGVTYKLQVTGLKGGHSGMDIDKERGNSIKLLGRALVLLQKDYRFNLALLAGGSKNNAIPREAEGVLVFDQIPSDLSTKVQAIEKILGDEIKTQDEGFKLVLSESSLPEKTYDDITTKNVIELLYLLPNGVESQSQDIKGLVETSLNLGVLTERNDHLDFDFAVRSSVRSKKDMLMDKVRMLGEKYGAEVIVTSSYPEWQYAKESKIRDTFIAIYKEKYGIEPGIEAIHAGLECGILAGRIEGLDMISLGPNLYDVHTPNEHMSIPSVKNVYEFLLEVLKALK
jgi:dipeptidase D